MRRLKYENVWDILVGCTILSTGGGGDLQKGLDLVREDFEKGFKYSLVPLDEIDDDGLFASPYFCGSIGQDDKDDRFYSYKKNDDLETIAAVKALEKHFDQKLSGIVSIEYGGMNTAVAMSTAARMGKPIVDADAAGRAVPDLQFSTFYVHSVPICPLSVADSIGDVAVFHSVVDDFRAEDMVRALSVVSGGMIGMADHPCKGKDLKNAVISNALSYAEKVGRAQRLAAEAGENAVEKIIQAADGYLLFDGIVKEDTKWQNKDGFTIGKVDIKGRENFNNSEFRIWFKNENVICWQDGKTKVSAPDLICVVDSKTGYPITNPNCKEGMNVAVLGFKAPDVWRTDRGLSILNPKFFGFDEKYVPIEDSLK